MCELVLYVIYDYMCMYVCVLCVGACFVNILLYLDMRMRPDMATSYPGRTYRFYTGTIIAHKHTPTLSRSHTVLHKQIHNVHKSHAQTHIYIYVYEYNAFFL